MRESRSGNRPRSSSASRASRLRPFHRVSRMLVSSSPLVASTSSSTSKVALSRLRPHPWAPLGQPPGRPRRPPSSRPRGHWEACPRSRRAYPPSFPPAPAPAGPAGPSRLPPPRKAARQQTPTPARCARCRRRARPPPPPRPAVRVGREPERLSPTTRYRRKVHRRRALADASLEVHHRYYQCPVSFPTPRFTATQPANSAKTVKLGSCEHVIQCSQTTVNTVTCEESFPVTTAYCEQSKQ